jgi:hypothetical protein
MKDYYKVQDTLQEIKVQKDLDNTMETVNQLIFNEDFYSVKASLDEFIVSDAIKDLTTFTVVSELQTTLDYLIVSEALDEIATYEDYLAVSTALDELIVYYDLLEIEKLEQAEEVTEMLNIINIYESLVDAETTIDEQIVMDSLE